MKMTREEMMNKMCREVGLENKWTIWFCAIAENTSISDEMVEMALACAETMVAKEFEEN